MTTTGFNYIIDAQTHEASEASIEAARALISELKKLLPEGMNKTSLHANLLGLAFKLLVMYLIREEDLDESPSVIYGSAQAVGTVLAMIFDADLIKPAAEHIFKGVVDIAMSEREILDHASKPKSSMN